MVLEMRKQGERKRKVSSPLTVFVFAHVPTVLRRGRRGRRRKRRRRRRGR
jgi:hypothetical protein